MGMSWVKIAMKDFDRLELEWNGLEQMRTVAGLAQIVARTGGDGLDRKWMRSVWAKLAGVRRLPKLPAGFVRVSFPPSPQHSDWWRSTDEPCSLSMSKQHDKIRPALLILFKAMRLIDPVQENPIYHEDSILHDYSLFFALIPSTECEFKILRFPPLFKCPISGSYFHTEFAPFLSGQFFFCSCYQRPLCPSTPSLGALSNLSWDQTPSLPMLFHFL